MEARGSPSRTLLLICLLMALVNALLVGGGLARRAARAGLETSIQTLRANLSTLATLRSDQRTQLETALADARARVGAAEAALPQETKRLDLFRLGYELAAEHPVLVLSLRREESEVRETPLGPIEVNRNRILAQAGLDACLDYIAAIEALGPGVGLASVAIRPDQLECDFDVLTLSRGP